MHIIKLKSGKEISVQRRHPWVFSGALQSFSKNISDGDAVHVADHQGQILATAYYQGGGSIALRIIAWEATQPDEAFWQDIIGRAVVYRRSIQLGDNSATNTYRLFHGEGDGVPGLIIDIYHDIAVIQCHAIGIHRDHALIAQAVLHHLPIIRSIYIKSKDTLPEQYAMTVEDGLYYGDHVETLVKEHGIQFHINVETGQKTGFFLDQRVNRDLVGQYSEGRSVLNCFCYTGGFSLYALRSGATSVTSVDISQKAMDLVDRNVALNAYAATHTSHCANVMHFLGDDELPTYEIVIVDPPAFAKSIHKRHNAVQAYKRLNILALRKVKSGGMLFTFSCSQVVGTQLFYDTIVAAAMEEGRQIRVMQHLSQGPDHPVNIYHPEGHYLKGLMLYVE
jgi:23S rRNA (cytosine1962-C5)-methyltransferase